MSGLDERVLKLLDATADPDAGRVLDTLIEASGAQRGFLVLRTNGSLTVHTARHMDGDDVQRAHAKVSKTLLERALKENKPLVAAEADVEGIQSLQEQKVRAVCAVPLASCEAVVYLDHLSQKGVFDDLPGLARLARPMDAALRARRELERLRAREATGGLVGTSKPMQELRAQIDRIAAAPYPVLVLGESGTGKELVARAIHRGSPRAAGPFTPANCARFAKDLVASELFGHVRGAFTGAERDHQGLFKQADGGILFLDEIGCLSDAGQESLLRVLETGEIRRVGAAKTERVDVRVIAATNDNLEDPEIFREDLYYRLNILRVDLPPLRHRREDIPELAEYFLERIAREMNKPKRRLTPDGVAALLEHPWRGNVRELENGLRRAAAMSEGPDLDAAAFGFLGGPREESDDLVSLDEHLRRMLERWSGTMEAKELARRLGISRKTLWEKKKKLGL